MHVHNLIILVAVGLDTVKHPHDLDNLTLSNGQLPNCLS